MEKITPSKTLFHNAGASSLLAGTGFMQSPLEALEHLKRLGYSEGVSLCFDHLEVRERRERLFPEDFEVDGIFRFENSSDPDDQSILYAISSRRKGIKGIFMESYGLYHEEMSPALLRKFSAHPNLLH